MSLKSKIISKLKEKAQSLKINLSNVRINGLAEKLDAIVDNEDDIDGEIDKLDSILSFKELAILDDSKRNADRKKAEQEDEEEEEEDPAPAKTEKDKSKESDKTKDEVPSWAKSLIESNNALKAEITTLKSGNVTQSRRQQLEAKLKDAPDKFKTRTLRDFDRMKLESDDDFENYLAEVEQDVAEEVQASADAGLGIDTPSGGIGGKKLKDDEVSPAMKEMVQEREAAAKAKAGA